MRSGQRESHTTMSGNLRAASPLRGALKLPHVPHHCFWRLCCISYLHSIGLATVGLYSGRWSLRTWKRKWGIGEMSLSYTREKTLHLLWLQENSALKNFSFFFKTLKYEGERGRAGNLIIIPPCLRNRESGDIRRWFLWELDKVVCALTVKALIADYKVVTDIEYDQIFRGAENS